MGSGGIAQVCLTGVKAMLLFSVGKADRLIQFTQRLKAFENAVGTEIPCSNTVSNITCNETTLRMLREFLVSKNCFLLIFQWKRYLYCRVIENLSILLLHYSDVLNMVFKSIWHSKD